MKLAEIQLLPDGSETLNVNYVTDEIKKRLTNLPILNKINKTLQKMGLSKVDVKWDGDRLLITIPKKSYTPFLFHLHSTPKGLKHFSTRKNIPYDFGDGRFIMLINVLPSGIGFMTGNSDNRNYVMTKSANETIKKIEHNLNELEKEMIKELGLDK